MFRIFVLAVSFWFASSLAMADEPAYYQVSGVDSSDVLNIRAEPNAGSEQIGGFQPDAAPVEVLEIRDVNGSKWGRVHSFELDGWVSMRFLAPIEVELIENTRIPMGLNCGGTEPFWNVNLLEEVVSFSPMGAEPIELPLEISTTTRGRNHRFAVVAIDRGKRLTAMISRGEQCSDGMSDRNYGWRADVLIEDPTNAEIAGSYEGCCSLRLK
ncbi:MAG: SH3 domain-containing protein [Rhizobiaceae bacterium]